MRYICTSIVAMLVLAGTVSSEPSSEAPPAPPTNEVHEHAHGDVANTKRLHLTNCVVPTESLRFSTTPIHIPRGSVNVETIHDSGDPANRLDLVFVGDGYTAAEIPAYIKIAQDRTDFILDYNPFDQYRNWINIHRVDVISAESGVDNDPANGNVDVDTAMDMYFNSDGGLLMDWSLAHAYANLAPALDCIMAGGNTVTYGGVGTGIDVFTFPGSNTFSEGILMHEMGHSLMHLADEYYYEGDVFTRGELPNRNVSIKNADEMSFAETKWAHWLGYSIPGVGIHDTFEGGHYHEFGVYRPTADSVMNWLENPLNGPGIEGTILQMHLSVDPIESISHPDIVVDDDAILSADILHPNGHQLEITWRVNGDVVATGSPTLDLGSIDLPTDANLVELTVVDPNPLVRDERLRSDFLTSRRAWVAYTGAAPNGACCLGESCFVTSEAECAANTGYWVEGEDCNGIGCYWFDDCMLVDSFAAPIDADLPPSMDVVGASVRRLPGNLIEARIELAGLLPADDPGIGNRLYRILVDTDAPFMTGVDWDDVDQEWGVKPIGGSYRGASTGVLNEVVIDGNTIIMRVDPNVLSAATEIAFFADAADWEASIFDAEALGQGSVPRWEDLDDDGIPDHCEVPGTTHDVCPAGCTYTTIQQAFDAANNGDEILVGPGTYTSTSDNVVNTLGKNVLLHSSHGPDQTFIDGQGLRRGILANSGETSQTVIEGFTIQNCQADVGGAIRCVWDSQPTFRNCIIRNNQANFGGGMWNEEDTTLIDCIFEGNTATGNGGGIDNPWGGSPTLIRCSFISNTAGGNGGGIQNYQAGTSVFTECSFIDNIANYGGGVNHNNSTNTVLLDCTFDGNEAELGGGIYAEGGILDVEACSFTNHAGGAGGGLCSDGTSVTVTGSDFIGNSVYWDGGGIDANWGDLLVDNCRFDNNEANYLGGGISIYGTSTQITDCRISGNIAGETGGGLQISETVVNITDTMFCVNLPNHVAGEITGSGIEFLDVCPADCDGDINGDGQVSVDDLLTVIAEWDMPYDVNDILTVIANWGACP